MTHAFCESCGATAPKSCALLAARAQRHSSWELQPQQRAKPSLAVLLRATESTHKQHSPALSCLLGSSGHGFSTHSLQHLKTAELSPRSAKNHNRIILWLGFLPQLHGSQGLAGSLNFPSLFCLQLQEAERGS